MTRGHTPRGERRLMPVFMRPAFLLIVSMTVPASPPLIVAAAMQVSSKAKDRPPPPPSANTQQLFQQGESALKKNDLDLAERSFRSVLAVDPQAVGAYANLGVIYMRRKQWQHALEMLHHAERLAPAMTGLRLNIGLVYYRQGDFKSAIPPFESVVH